MGPTPDVIAHAAMITDMTAFVVVSGLSAVSWGLFKGTRDGRWVGGFPIAVGGVTTVVGLTGLTGAVAVLGGVFDMLFWLPPMVLLGTFAAFGFFHARDTADRRGRRSRWGRRHEEAVDEIDGLDEITQPSMDIPPKLRTESRRAEEKARRRRRHRPSWEILHESQIIPVPADPRPAPPVDPAERLKRVLRGDDDGHSELRPPH